MTRRTFRSTTTILREQSARCQELADRLLHERRQVTVRRLFQATHDELLAATQRRLDERSLADTLGQTLLQARLAWAFADPRLQAMRHRPGVFPPAESLLGQTIRFAIGPHPLLVQSDAVSAEVEAILLASELWARQTHDSSRSLPGSDGRQELTADREFDSFLGAHDPRGRARHGVYFTPRPVATFIVQEIDRLLRQEFALPDGLADTTTWSELSRSAGSKLFSRAQADSPFVNILDPAAGAGVFLIEVIDRIFTTWEHKSRALTWTAEERVAAWNEYVVRYLLPRLSAMDLLLPACAVAWIRIADKLATTGYRFESALPLGVALGDSLAGPNNRAVIPGLEPGDTEVSVTPFTVILGNPPFSALTTSGNAWINGLLRTANVNRRRVGGYYEVDGASLGEKKLWLHDDYVKFLRYAQWQIEMAGCGVVGLVTNHGYLDNLTFRGARQSLLTSFPRISLLDLHGNRKKREKSPTGDPDENVFGIDQGVAVGFFRRPPIDTSVSVTRADLWGTRFEKILALRSELANPTWQSVSPQSPHYLFTAPRASDVSCGEYSRGFPLPEIMPVHSTAAVTARDSFVVAFTAEELLERMQVLTDDSLSDDELRRRFFDRTRSRRYPPGDTRGWKLAEARQQSRRAGDPRAFVRRCLYRPFDWRWVLWADWMIDWPRKEVMRHMLAGDNLALVTRRQMIPNQPANYFFVADSIVIDGLIRSDNRGSESFFPLHVAAAETGSESLKRGNFSTEFWKACAHLGPSERTVVPEDLFHMIYAQFHSMSFRDRYQSELCLGFPRVFVPRQAALFQTLVECGRQLVEAHLLRAPFSELACRGDEPCDLQSLRVPARDWPRHSQEKLWITADWCLDQIPAATWDFHVGGYQVCRKWLRERAGRVLTPSEITHFSRIVAAVSDTLRIMAEIESAIALAGGWPAAFVGRNR